MKNIVKIAVGIALTAIIIWLLLSSGIFANAEETISYNYASNTYLVNSLAHATYSGQYYYAFIPATIYFTYQGATDAVGVSVNNQTSTITSGSSAQTGYVRAAYQAGVYPPISAAMPSSSTTITTMDSSYTFSWYSQWAVVAYSWGRSSDNLKQVAKIEILQNQTLDSQLSYQQYVSGGVYITYKSTIATLVSLYMTNGDYITIAFPQLLQSLKEPNGTYLASDVTLSQSLAATRQEYYDKGVSAGESAAKSKYYDTIISNSPNYTTGYNSGYQEGLSAASGETILDTPKSVFASVWEILNVKIFGDFSFATLLIIIVSLGVISLVWKIARG